MTLSELKKLFKKNPKKYVLDLARYYLKEGQPKQAMHVLNKINVDKNIEYSVLLARSHFDSFDIKSANAILKQVQNIEDHFEANLLRGEIELEFNNTNESILYLQNAFKINPKNRRVAVLLNNLGKKVAIPEEKEEIHTFSTDQTSEETPSRAFAQVLIGLILCLCISGSYLYFAKKSYKAQILSQKAKPLVNLSDVKSIKQAIDIFNEALTYNNNDDVAISGLAEAYALLWVIHGLDKYREDAKHFSQLAHSKNIERAERYTSNALIFYADKKFQKANDIIEEPIKKNAVSSKLYWLFGLTQKALNQEEKSLTYFRNAYESDLQVPLYAHFLGDAYGEENFSKAAQYWEKSFQNNNDYISGVARSLLVKIKRGNLADVEKELKRVDSLSEDSFTHISRANIETARALFYYAQGHFDKAKSSIDKAIKINLINSRRADILGHILLAKQKNKKAIHFLKKASELTPNSRYYIFRLAQAYTHIKKYNKAIDLVKSTQKIKDDSRYYNEIADIYREQKNYKKAIAFYNKALKKNKRSVTSIFGKGFSLWKLNKKDEALEYFNKVVGIRKTFAPVYEVMGLMTAELGLSKEANDYLKQAEGFYKKQGADYVEKETFYKRIIQSLSKIRSSKLDLFWKKRLKRISRK